MTPEHNPAPAEALRTALPAACLHRELEKHPAGTFCTACGRQIYLPSRAAGAR
jgi:hypothetical protein